MFLRSEYGVLTMNFADPSIVSLLALGTSITTLITALIGLWKTRKVEAKTTKIELSVNHELAEVKRLLAANARAEGVIEGAAAAGSAAAEFARSDKAAEIVAVASEKKKT